MLMLLSGDPLSIGNLPSGEVGGPDVTHFALRDEIIERCQCLLERSEAIGRVILVKVDVVGLQTVETSLHSAPYVPTRSTRNCPFTHVRTELRRQHDALAPTRQHLTQKLL